MGLPNLWVYNIFIDEVHRPYTGFTVGASWPVQEKWDYLFAIHEVGGNTLRLVIYVSVYNVGSILHMS